MEAFYSNNNKITGKNCNGLPNETCESFYSVIFVPIMNLNAILKNCLTLLKEFIVLWS